MCTVLSVFDEIDFSDCFPIEGQGKQEVIDNPIIHLCLPAQKEIYDIAVSDNYVLNSNKSSSAVFFVQISKCELQMVDKILLKHKLTTLSKDCVLSSCKRGWR